MSSIMKDDYDGASIRGGIDNLPNSSACQYVLDKPKEEKEKMYSKEEFDSQVEGAYRIAYRDGFLCGGIVVAGIAAIIGMWAYFSNKEKEDKHDWHQTARTALLERDEANEEVHKWAEKYTELASEVQSDRVARLTAIPLTAEDKDEQEKVNELSECKRLMAEYEAQAEVVMEDGSRCDLLSKEYAIEVDWAKSKWKESIGQAVLYSIWTGRKPAVLLLVKDREGEKVDILRCKLVCEKLGITMFVEDSPGKKPEPTEGTSNRRSKYWAAYDRQRILPSAEPHPNACKRCGKGIYGNHNNCATRDYGKERWVLIKGGAALQHRCDRCLGYGFIEDMEDVPQYNPAVSFTKPIATIRVHRLSCP